ncbi:DsbA family protein [Gynuella sp.]|uniref:DsbA family protein n=1 Tax=Gynuella sp. TaxID=2969146 RepID=UPI003D099C0C
MNQVKLHYLFDPLCGWCYGAAPLLEELAVLSDVSIELHAGGLWLGNRRQPMGKALRDYVRPHDERIESLTGQPFGERYFNELLLDSRLRIDSEPPIRAILALVMLGGNGLTMLHRIQQSHYRDGLWVGDKKLLVDLALEQEIEPPAFVSAYDDVDLNKHLNDSQDWLRQLGGSGYPTLGIERNGQLLPVPISLFYGNPEGIRQHVNQILLS